MDDCVFCSPRIAHVALSETEHYRVIADEYPRCAGHVLLLSKPHLVGHMDAPLAWLEELSAAQGEMWGFLLDSFGRASFWEHGGMDKEVAHAHLHATPIDVVLGPEWINSGCVQRVDGFYDAWRHHQQGNDYVYLEGREGAYLVFDEAKVLREVRQQFVSQTGIALDPAGGLRRHGPEVVAATRKFWETWADRR